jgi:[ribosomal protein S18]-alanine N-acetyltransferase
MSDLKLPYLVVQMMPEDIIQVAVIDRLSFSTPWSVNAYRYELTQNDTAHYYVVIPNHPPATNSGDGHWLSRLRRRFTITPSNRNIIGYGGFWLMVDEAHISTIAIHPDFRRRGIGEFLLLKLIEKAIGLKANQVTLEVRESNYGAQTLYHKYGFGVTGRRAGYYTDNHEDALLMTVENVLTPAYQQTLATLKAALIHRLTTPKPPIQDETDYESKSE